jgi:hypothetical protein
MREEADQDMMDLAGFAAEQKAERLSVKFTVEPQENPEKSKKAGRPIFDDVEMCEIRIPGDADVRRQPVTTELKQRFARQYLAFKSGQSQETASGTPLAAWALLKRSQVEEARYFGVHTVEQLSEVPDSNMNTLGPGWIDLRQKARDWLEAAADGAKLNELRSELLTATQRISTLEEMLTRQAAALQQAGVTPQTAPTAPPVDVQALVASAVQEAMARVQVPVVEAPVKRGRGRPRKYA